VIALKSKGGWGSRFADEGEPPFSGGARIERGRRWRKGRGYRGPCLRIRTALGGVGVAPWGMVATLKGGGGEYRRMEG